MQKKAMRQQWMSKLTRPSDERIDRPVRLTPDLGSSSFKMGIEITSVLWKCVRKVGRRTELNIAIPK